MNVRVVGVAIGVVLVLLAVVLLTAARTDPDRGGDYGRQLAGLQQLAEQGRAARATMAASHVTPSRERCRQLYRASAASTGRGWSDEMAAQGEAFFVAGCLGIAPAPG